MTREVVWDHGVSLPEHSLWLDPLVVRTFAFISHAHTDHARRHKEALLTPQTLALIPEARRPRGWRMLGYDEPMRYAGLTMCVIFLVGLIILPFAPETKDQPLPE